MDNIQMGGTIGKQKANENELPCWSLALSINLVTGMNREMKPHHLAHFQRNVQIAGTYRNYSYSVYK